MNSRLFPILLLCLTGIAPSAAASEQALTVTVSPASVAVTAAEPGRRFLTLPDLDYQFLLEPRCEPASEVAGLSLSVADSRWRLSPDQLADAVIEATLTVPAEQLAPLPVTGFCELVPQANPPTVIAEKIIVPAALSLQASLLCTGEEQQRMTYTAAALDVELNCSPTEDTDTETAGSQ